MNKHWLVEGIIEWSQLFWKFNWYTFTVINIEFEKDDMVHGYEFRVIVLGLGFRIRYNTDKALEQFEEWAKEVNEGLTINNSLE
jgi:hypothetical protein